VIRLNPDFRMAHYMLGLTLWNQGQPREAAIEFAAAIRPNAGTAPARKDPAAPEGRPRPASP
jgi:hypothetical protein